MTYKQFESNWIGKRTNPDGVFFYQCVDLIRQYFMDLYGLPGTGAWGNAIDYWTKPNANVLNVADKVSGSNAQQGDIVIMYGHTGNPYGHIGIATGNINGSTVEILEQNGSTGNGSGVGGDAIRKRYVSRSRVAGLLRLKGRDDMVDDFTLLVLTRWYFGRNPSKTERDKYLGKAKSSDIAEAFRNSSEYAKVLAKAKSGTISFRDHLPTTMKNVFKFIKL